MDIPMYIDKISLELSILYFKGMRLKFKNYDVFVSPIDIISEQTVQTLMKCCNHAAFNWVCTVCQSTMYMYLCICTQYKKG